MHLLFGAVKALLRLQRAHSRMRRNQGNYNYKYNILLFPNINNIDANRKILISFTSIHYKHFHISQIAK